VGRDIIGRMIKYVHTNLIARDWRALASFYQQVFECVPVPPERDLKGDAVSAGTGIPGAHICGVHLRLPGWGDDGPTLELFNYNVLQEGSQPAVNRPGFAHIAFSVEDVPAVHARAMAAGATAIGEVVSTKIATGATVSWCYLRDPEGNVIELQAWSGK